MLGPILRLPLFVILMGISAVAMYIPAAHAAALRDFDTMRVFFQAGNLLLILTSMIGLATSGRVIKNQSRSYLLALLATFTVLPALLAVPFAVSVPDTTFFNAYVEMVSDLTTTGATLFNDPDRLPASVHLWRAIVGWLGGILMLIAAVAILAPLRLGGFEVLSDVKTTRSLPAMAEAAWLQMGSVRLLRITRRIAPIYAALTLVLWVVLLALGDRPIVAISHAMSVMSTSGISPVGGMSAASSGFGGEAFVFLFLMIALSRQVLFRDSGQAGFRHLNDDPEFRLALVLIALIPLFLLAHHWIWALDAEIVAQVQTIVRAYWGTLFTVLSFLTTTGFVSADWATAQQWSGLENPGMILMGLAVIGGGVATTAGGVKLLRVYAMYRHGSREMDRLVFPSSVGGSGTAARRLRRQGAFIAWVFFMLFGLSLALTIVGFTLAGLGFEQAATLAVAALSTTGPIVTVGSGVALDLANIGALAKTILVVAMVLGRLETLAIVALLNPEFWRK